MDKVIVTVHEMLRPFMLRSFTYEETIQIRDTLFSVFDLELRNDKIRKEYIKGEFLDEF